MRAVVHHGPRRWSRNVWFQSGDVIIREGDLVTETSSVYMIEEGEVSIEIDDDVVAVRRKTYCGEITKVGERRTASVRARGKVRATEMDRETFAEQKKWYFLTPVELHFFRAANTIFDKRNKVIAAVFVTATSVMGSVIVAAATAAEPKSTKISSIVLFTMLLAEICIRLAVSKPMTIVRNPWNWYALLVVVAWLPVYKRAPHGSRSLILLRSLQYAMTLPKLRTLVYGTLGGLQMMTFITMCIFLLVYVYAIVGLSLFKDNDPWHFGDLQRAMTTLFRAATLEDWTEIFYVNYFGCDVYTAGIYMQVNEETKLKYSNCISPRTRPGPSVYFFFSFIMLCLATFAMFIAALSIKMAEAVKQVHRETVVKRVKMERKMTVLHSTDIMKQRNSFSNSISWEAEEKSYKAMSVTEMNNRNMVRCLLREVFEGKPCPHIEVPESTELRRNYVKMSVAAQEIVHSVWFNAFIICVLIISAILMGVETSDSAMASLDMTASGLWAWNFTVAVIFMLEMILKVVECGFSPWHVFFKDNKICRSNCFDFFVVVTNLSVLSTLSSGGTWVVLLRASRLLKVFSGDAMKNFPSMRLPVLSLVMAAEMLAYTAALLLALVFCFAASAVSSFRRNDGFHFGTLRRAMLTLFRCGTLEDWSDVLYTQMYGCDAYPPAADYQCTESERQPVLALVFFVTFVCVVSLIAVNALTGVICTQMEQALLVIRNEALEDGKLRRVIRLNCISRKEVKFYLRVYELIDLSHDGLVALEEFQAALLRAGIVVSRQSVKIIMRRIDPNFNETRAITPVSFIQLVASIKHTNTRDPIYTLNQIVAGQYLGEQCRRFLRRRNEAVKAQNDKKIRDLHRHVKRLTDRCSVLESEVKLSALSVESKEQATNAEKEDENNGTLAARADAVPHSSHENPLSLADVKDVTSVVGRKIFV